MVLLMDYLLYPALIAANHWTDQELQEALPQLLSNRKEKKKFPLQKGQRDHNLQNLILKKTFCKMVSHFLFFFATAVWDVFGCVWTSLQVMTSGAPRTFSIQRFQQGQEGCQKLGHGAWHLAFGVGKVDGLSVVSVFVTLPGNYSNYIPII